MTGLEKIAQILVITLLVMIFSEIFVQFKFADKYKESGCSKLNLFANGLILPWKVRAYPLVVIQILTISLTIYLTLVDKMHLF